MSPLKKGIGILLAVLAFAGCTAGFFFLLKSAVPQTQNAEALVYHRPAPETEASETVPEVTAEETQPVQTLPAENLPPETVPEETAARIVYETVPLYDQTQYSDILYRSGTVATSGSNITCLAMTASYLTGYEYRPDMLARYFASYIGNTMQWLEYASDQLQLPWEKAANIDVTIQALREGKIAIAVMNENSVFRDTPHFVVFTGITEDGKLLVNDPYGPNYSSWNLQNALVTGFSRGDLSGKYAGAWIYDPAAMPAVPFVYEAAENTDEFRYPGVVLTQEDKALMAKLLCAEAASEPFEGQQAIAEVILNRLLAGNFPSSVSGIIYAEGQFAAADSLYLAQPTHIQYEAIERALYGPYILPADVVFFAKFAVNDNVWGTIGSHTFCHQW